MARYPYPTMAPSARARLSDRLQGAGRVAAPHYDSRLGGLIQVTLYRDEKGTERVYWEPAPSE